MAKIYNNSITGESWHYPEFKRYHVALYGVVIENKESSFSIYNEEENIFLQMLQPLKPVGANNNYVKSSFCRRYHWIYECH